MSSIPTVQIASVARLPFATSPEAVRKMYDLQRSDPVAFEKKMTQKVKEYLTLQHNAQYHPNDPKVLDIVKSHSGISNKKDLGDFTGRRINVYTAMIDELEIDMGWMAAFRMVDLTGTSVAEILDFTALGGWKKYESLEEIKPTPWGTEALSELREDRHGKAIGIPNRWLETNATYNINTAFSTITNGRLTYQGDLGYTQLADATGVPVQTSTGASVDNIVDSINNAADKLLKANSKKGFAISPTSRIVVYYAHDHGNIMDQVRNRMRGEDGDNRVLRFNFEFIMTYNSNFPSQLESTKNGVMLTLPGLKNVWGTFKPLAQQTEFKFSTDSTIVTAQEYFNYQLPATQKYVARLQA